MGLLLVLLWSRILEQPAGSTHSAQQRNVSREEDGWRNGLEVTVYCCYYYYYYYYCYYYYILPARFLRNH